MKNIPLSFAWLYLLIAVYAAPLALLPFCPWIQKALMEKFHLRSPSFAQWSVLQFAPSMYNFANRMWLTKTYVSPQDLLSRSHQSLVIAAVWTNHYPFWPVTFTSRTMLFSSPKDYTITLRTSFQKQELWTVYHLNPDRQWTRIDHP